MHLDLDAWSVDLRAASPTPRGHAERWRSRLELAGGITNAELRATRAEDAGVDLPRCVKTRIPNPDADDPQISPWGVVLGFIADEQGLLLDFLAFEVRHPDRPGSLPSVYQRAHRRLNAP